MPAHVPLLMNRTENSTSNRKTSDQLGPLNKQLRSEVRDMAIDYIDYRLKYRKLVWSECPNLPEPTPAILAMRIMGSRIESKNLQVLSELSFDFTEGCLITEEAFMTCAKGLFLKAGYSTELEVNWGRIVTLFAWSGILAARSYQLGEKELILSIVEWVTKFAETHLLQWIESHESWDGFLTFSQEKDVIMDQPMWPKFVLAGIIGVGAVALGCIITGKES